MMYKQVVTTLLLCVAMSSVIAYEPSAPPYANDKFPDNCSMNELKPIMETSRTQAGYKSSYRVKQGTKIYQLNLVMDYAEKTFGLYAGLSVGNKQLITRVRIGDYPTYIDQVYSGFLNKDERPDFIVSMQAGDKNLVGNRQHGYFLLSTEKGYVVRKLINYALESNDFYDYTQDDKCEYLHVSFLSDQRQHFWVYNVLQFIDDEIAIKNRLSRYFPKWIEFASSVDKSAAISTQDKQRLWTDFLRKNEFVEKIPVE